MSANSGDDTRSAVADGLTPEVADRLAGTEARVVVLGDSVLDLWLWGRSERLCREAPVPVVDIDRSTPVPGGAANTAANLAALGATVDLVSLTGADDRGATLRAALAAAGVGVRHLLACPGRSTLAKCRVVSGEQILVRYDDGDRSPATADQIARLLRPLPDLLAAADAVVVCDYDGAVADRVRAELAPLRDTLPLLVVDTHHPARWRELRPDVVTPNAGEAAEALGLAPLDGANRVEVFTEHRDRLFEMTGAGAAVVTLDRDGAVLLDGARPAHRTWAEPVAESQSAGAGDTFVAALTLALVDGLPLAAAAEVAQAAADVVVHRTGTAVCSTAQLRDRLGRTGSAVLGRAELARAVRAHRGAGRRIVFTNGCFDVLHAGHVSYLNEAKRLGDVLIVAVNSDDSVRALKGPERPVNTAADRAAVLAALSCVDHVVVFPEQTPAALLRDLRPDLYVKGGDYRPEMLPETPVVRGYGGEVRVLGYLADRSTTALIERIRANAGAS
ncbi:D-glycero-beta-D-manno-heptose 1-phosphate adenylyltransferase [Nocardia asteroides]|uniref:D-glycero-beta-D-manno-heptose 1-phosphate adenylyltransferase n=1 Tax=Nocardia asteroides TaxID=1824 RepID=UPI001E3CBDC4|nr:D-glycero-beta-D-manno-heptose 1-phosphate adenylyltransferase [Nocardia asteroides]UGT60970.1 D-glycero-beta-D-manno-heptose 1-phosphate adenylyltransferase [Nocardia asteroides]